MSDSTALRCRLGWHKWNWRIDFEPSPSAPIVTCFRCTERCDLCGLTKIRETHWHPETGEEIGSEYRVLTPR